MHVAIVGAGALGRVYGVRLAAAGTDVTFVVRASRMQESQPPLCIARVDGDKRQDELAAPRRSASVPAEADVIVVCVRAEQVDAPLERALAAAPDVPVVMLTPLMPAALETLCHALGQRVVVAMPGVVAYVRNADRPGEEVTRYWLPRVAPTLIDETSRDAEVDSVTGLVDALVKAGLPARIEHGVRETNPATTVSFIPLAMALDVAGGSDALLADGALLALAIEAARASAGVARA